MAHLNLVCFLVICLSLALVCGETRKARSPQFSHASAQAQAGGFGRPNFAPRPPVIPPRPPIIPPRAPIIPPRPPVIAPRPPAFGGGFSRPGSSISISKSVSISRGGGGGGASSKAESKAYGK